MMKGSRLENRVLMHPHLSLKALISLFLPPSLSLFLFFSHSSVYLRWSNLIHSYITDANYLSTPKYLSAQQTLFNPSFQNFITCSNRFHALYEPHVSASPVPLWTFTIQLLLQSSGNLPSFTTALHIIIHPQCTTSFAGSSLEHLFCNSLRPADLPCFIFPIALTTLPIDPFTRPKHWTYIGQNQFCPK